MKVGNARDSLQRSDTRNIDISATNLLHSSAGNINLRDREWQVPYLRGLSGDRELILAVKIQKTRNIHVRNGHLWSRYKLLGFLEWVLEYKKIHFPTNPKLRLCSCQSKVV